MEIQETAALTLAAYCETKRRFVQDEGGPSDLIPQLDVLCENGEVLLGMPSDRETIPDTLDLMRGATDSPVVAVTMLADSYAVREQHRENIPLRGSLADRFRGGDMTVHEALVATTVDARTGEAVSLFVAYRYDDAGGIEFDDTPDENDVVAGAVVQILRSYFGFHTCEAWLGSYQDGSAEPCGRVTNRRVADGSTTMWVCDEHDPREGR